MRELQDATAAYLDGKLYPPKVLPHPYAFNLFSHNSAIDPAIRNGEWKTLNRWWLGENKRRWTSVSFLIDRRGVIRHIHPGGLYEKGDEAYQALKARIEELVKEK